MAQISSLQLACAQRGGTFNEATDPAEFVCTGGDAKPAAQTHKDAAGAQAGPAAPAAPVAPGGSGGGDAKTVNGQAALPNGSNTQKTLADMKVGDTDYTTPWGMWEDLSHRMWLNPNYDAEANPFGTVHMKVVHEAKGYHVWISSSDDEARYTPEKAPSYVGQADSKWIPVATLTILP